MTFCLGTSLDLYDTSAKACPMIFGVVFDVGQVSSFFAVGFDCSRAAVVAPALE